LEKFSEKESKAEKKEYWTDLGRKTQPKLQFWKMTN